MWAQPAIAQEYITKPLLYQGHKFHFRLYFVIASLDPLRLLLSEQGLVLFASKPYNEVDSLSDMNIHLTNAARHQGGPPAMTLKDFWNAIRKGAMKLNEKHVMSAIEDMLIKVAFSAQVSAGSSESTTIKPGGRGMNEFF